MKWIVMTSMFLMIFVALDMAKFSYDEYQLSRQYVTTSGSKWCYTAGSENGNMKENKKQYFSTVALCQKELKGHPIPKP